MTTKIQKWGNSLAVRLPQYLVEKLGLEAGTSVVIDNERGQIIKIKPTMKTKLSLKNLVKRINLSNRHEETDWGNSAGKETW